jgi:hypothetical protein
MSALNLWEYFVLQERLVDWVSISFIMRHIELNTGLTDERFVVDEMLRFLRRAVGRGWMRIGPPHFELGSPNGPDWWNISGEQAVRLVRCELMKLGRRPVQPEIAWLLTTVEGQRTMAEYDKVNP